jgi:uncharacterized protein YqjF (DUF2071 family)
VNDRLVRFPGISWQQIEALPQPLRWTVQRTIFHLLEEPVPAPADPFPLDDPLPGAYELHLPADDVTIWYTVSEHEGQEVISAQLRCNRLFTAAGSRRRRRYGWRHRRP